MDYGSEDHKKLFCGFFIDTHIDYRPEEFPWPALDDATVDKLKRFPIWDHAVHTESQVHRKLAAYGEPETDPLLRQALLLQAEEELRHANLLRHFLGRYGIPYNEKPAEALPADLEGGFRRTAAGECIDSFFAFGFIALSKSTHDYPLELIEVMEIIVQEEARHILFIQNWFLYRLGQRPWPHRPAGHLAVLAAYAAAGLARLRDLSGLGGSAFTMQARTHEASSMTARQFIQLCLSENRRRMLGYDRRLARPKLVPRLAGLMGFFL
jgi:hypothetical protein